MLINLQSNSSSSIRLSSSKPKSFAFKKINSRIISGSVSIFDISVSFYKTVNKFLTKMQATTQEVIHGLRSK